VSPPNECFARRHSSRLGDPDDRPRVNAGARTPRQRGLRPLLVYCRHGTDRGAAALTVRQAEAEVRSPAPGSSTRLVERETGRPDGGPTGHGWLLVYCPGGTVGEAAALRTIQQRQPGQACPSRSERRVEQPERSRRPARRQTRVSPWLLSRQRRSRTAPPWFAARRRSRCLLDSSKRRPRPPAESDRPRARTRVIAMPRIGASAPARVDACSCSFQRRARAIAITERTRRRARRR
jgi:hypothetical protein